MYQEGTITFQQMLIEVNLEVSKGMAVYCSENQDGQNIDIVEDSPERSEGALSSTNQNCKCKYV
jgi:hypothetical protein